MEEQFLDALRALGGAAGNGRLRESLGWDEAAYDGVRAALIEQGLVEPFEPERRANPKDEINKKQAIEIGK